MERQLWKRNFAPKDVPLWRCGQCGRGVLTLHTKPRITTGAFEGVEHAKEDPANFEWDWDVEHFAAFFKCTHCREETLCAGSTIWQQDPFDQGGTKFYRPEYFTLAPQMIDVPEIVDQIRPDYLDVF